MLHVLLQTVFTSQVLVPNTNIGPQIDLNIWQMDPITISYQQVESQIRVQILMQQIILPERNINQADNCLKYVKLNKAHAHFME